MTTTSASSHPQESDLWQGIDDCVGALSEAHAEQRDANAIFRALKEEEAQAFEGMDDDAMGRIARATQDALERRKRAQARVRGAATSLDERAAHLQALLTELDASEEPLAQLQEIRDLTQASLKGSDTAISERLRHTTAAIRTRLRETRAAEYRSTLDDIELACMELEDLGESTQATRDFVVGGMFMDVTRGEGRRRLDQELVMLHGRLREAQERRRIRDGQAAQVELRELLSLTLDHDGIARIPDLFLRVSVASLEGESELRRQALGGIARAVGPLETRFRVWMTVAAGLSPSAPPAERLHQLVEVLPPVEDTAQDLSEAASRLLLATGAEREDAALFWPVLEYLVPRDTRWAEAFLSVLWGNAPPASVLARWLLRTDGQASADAERLKRLLAGANPCERAALTWWGEARGLLARPDEDPEELLLGAWFDAHQPFPSLAGTLEGLASPWWNDSHDLSLVIRTLAVLNRESGLELPGAGKGGKGSRVYELVRAFETQGQDGVAASWGGKDARRRATEALDALHENRSPPGGPGRVIWREKIFPRLDGLRLRARQSATRVAALAELAELEPDSLIEAAIKEKGLHDVNPLARQQIAGWIESYVEHIPAEAADAPAYSLVLSLATRDEALRPELERLEAGTPLDRVAARLVRYLLDPALHHMRAVPGSLPKEVRSRFAQAIQAAGTSPALSWRFQMANERSWRVEAGRDALERIAGLGGVTRAVEGYVGARRFGEAEACLALASGAEHESLSSFLAARLAQARAEVRGEAEVFLVVPLEEALRDWPAQVDHHLRDRLAELRRGVAQVIDGIDEVPLLETQAAIERMDPLVAELTTESRLLAEGGVKEVEQYLHHALRKGLTDGTHQDTDLAILAFEAALSRDVGKALVAIRLAALPPSDPQRLALRRSGRVERETVALPPVRLRPVPEIKVASFGFRLRTAWDKVALSSGHVPASSPASVQGESQVRRLELLLLNARQLHSEGDERWRLWCGAWSLEVSWGNIVERDFARGEEHAQDAVRFLAAAPAMDSLTQLDEAILLWLACALERSGATIARTYIPWSDLRRQAGPALIRQVIHRFFDSRVVDVLAQLVADAARFGGVVLPRIVAQLDDRERFLRPALLRELLRAGVLGADRVEAAVELLGRWLPEAEQRAARRILAQLGQLPDDEWGTGEAEQRHLEPIVALGLPAEVASAVRDALVHRARARGGVDGRDARYSVQILTTLFYVSALHADLDEEVGLVAEVRYEHGPETMRNLQVELSLSSSGILPQEAQRVQRLPVLRRGVPCEVLFPLGVRPDLSTAHDGISTKATVLLVSVDSLGKITPLQRASSPLRVAAQYPHAGERTPYVTGKRVNNPAMIKGRDTDVSMILDKLAGAHQDNFVLIFGSRRIGKSTLLEKLRLDERIRTRYEPVHLDLEDLLKPDADSVCTFLERLAEHMSETMETPAARAVAPPSPISSKDPYTDFKGYLERVARVLPSGRRLLLLFDEFQMLFHEIRRAELRPGYGRPDTDLHANLIQSLRHWIQYLPVGFVVAGTRELKNELLGPSQRLFQLGLSVELAALDDTSARELVTEPAKKMFSVTTSAVKEICDLTFRLPNLLQIVCHEMFIRARNRQQTVVTRRDVLATLEEVSRSAEHFQFLLTPVQEVPTRRIIVRALAEIGVDDLRGTVEDVVEHLRVRGYGDLADAEIVTREIEILRDHDLVLHGTRYGTYRLRPPLLARHVLIRPEYALEYRS